MCPQLCQPPPAQELSCQPAPTAKGSREKCPGDLGDLVPPSPLRGQKEQLRPWEPLLPTSSQCPARSLPRGRDHTTLHSPEDAAGIRSRSGVTRLQLSRATGSDFPPPGLFIPFQTNY